MVGGGGFASVFGWFVQGFVFLLITGAARPLAWRSVHLVELCLCATMGFGDLLEMVGGTGRFQIVHVTLLCTPVLMMASHNLLQNFVASVPPHHCSAHSNVSALPLSAEDSLLVTVPLDLAGTPLRCQRYSSPQWQLLAGNRSAAPVEEHATSKGTEEDLEGCVDGWSYNMTERASTIISEVGLYFLLLSQLLCFTCVKPCSAVASGTWCVTSAL